MRADCIQSVNDLEEVALKLQGDKSEKLSEIYALQSYFMFQNQDFTPWMSKQRKATDITEMHFGKDSNQYL